MEVKIYLKAKRNKNVAKLTVFITNLASFVTFYIAFHFFITYKRPLTYDLRIRNTDSCFHLVSCYKKHVLGLK